MEILSGLVQNSAVDGMRAAYKNLKWSQFFVNINDSPFIYRIIRMMGWLSKATTRKQYIPLLLCDASAFTNSSTSYPLHSQSKKVKLNTMCLEPTLARK